MLHPEAKLLDMLPLFGLLPIIQENVWHGRIGGGPNADPVGAPVLRLLIGPCLDASDELLDGLERPPVAQEQVDEGGEPPVVIHCLLGPGLTGTSTARRPSLVLLSRNTVLPRPTLPEESQSNSVHAVDCAPDLGLRVYGGAHPTGERHHAICPPRLSWDQSGRPRTKPHRGRRTINRKTLLLVSRLLRRCWHWVGRAVKGRFEQFLQLLAPLLLLLLELPQLLLPVLLQQLIELGTLWLLPLLRLLSRLLLALLFLLLSLLLDGAKPDGPWRPLRDQRSLGPLVHRAGVLRRPVAARPVAYCDRVPLDPRSGRLGGSLLLLGASHLDPPQRWRNGLPHHGARRGVLGTS